MKLIKYADREMLAIELANRLLDELKSSLLFHSEVCFVVPGGTTPGPIFDILCAADIEWDRVHLFLSDERWVPENHNRSNTRVIKERFLIKRAAAAQFVPFYMPGKTPATASPILSEILANKMPISLLLLGMGATSLSLTSSMLPEVKYFIRNVMIEDARALVEEVLQINDPIAVVRRLEDFRVETIGKR